MPAFLNCWPSLVAVMATALTVRVARIGGACCGSKGPTGSEEMTDNKLQVTEFISVSELSNLIDVSYADIISKCMSLGMMVSINQRLEADVIELVAGEFGYTVEFIGIDDARSAGMNEVGGSGQQQ